MRTKKTRLRKQSGFRRLCLEHKQMQQELRELSMNALVNATSTTQVLRSDCPMWRVVGWML